jgi:hypothetical protein
MINFTNKELQMKKLLLTLIFLGLTSAYLNAASSFTGSVNIQNLIVLTETTPLSFGTIKAPTTGTAQVFVSPTSDSSVNVTVNGVPGGVSVGATRGIISINGKANTLVNFTFTKSPLLDNGSASLLWSISLQFARVTLSSAGVRSLGVGGSVTVPANAITGVYTGYYTLSARY